MPRSGRFTRADWRDEWYESHLAGRGAPWGPSPRVRLWIPVVISLLVQAPTAIFLLKWSPTGMVAVDLPPEQHALRIVIALLGPLALLGARKYPGPVVAFVAALSAIDFFVGDQNQGPPYIALAFAIVGAIVRGSRGWAWISVASAWIVTLVIALVAGISWHPGRIAGITFGILVVMGIGEFMRTRREHFTEARQRLAQRKQTEVQAERVRIARELHDVLAHSLSQINVQAGVGLHLMEKQPEKAAAALASIKETSKTALDEVRSVLGVLRAEGGDLSAPLVPEPDLSRLEGLAASVSSQGIAVTLANTAKGVPQAAQLAIYRIVQESLTNVVRHANATEVSVSVFEDDHSYRVVVTDNGRGRAGAKHSDGRGLLGMTERAELLGGTLVADETEVGGFRVAATIPRREHEA